MKVPTFFKNRYVLYITAILGTTNLLGYIAMENYDAMALLVVMFLLVRYFSKNIAFNICVAIIVTSIVTLNGKIQEGFKEGAVPIGSMSRRGGGSFNKKTSKSSDGEDTVKRKDAGQIKKDNPKKQTNISRSGGPRPTLIEDPVKPEDPEEPPKEEPPKEEPPKEEPPKEEPPKEEECPKGTELVKGECVPSMGEKKKPERFKNNVPSSKPAKFNNDDDDDMDVAAKMEDAYGNLNKMLGDGAMKSMASETKKLVAQQHELMNTLSSMTPSLNKAKETLENLNLPNMEEMTGILKKFTQ